MTPKQCYEERRRLQAERLHRQETSHKSQKDKEDDMEQRLFALMSSVERIASVMELWADLQEPKT